MKLLNGDIEIVTNKLESQGISNPSKSELAMSFVRYRRTGLLENSDWMAGSDVTMSDEWKIYHQSLRDLPQNSTPKLDSSNNLTGVNWPSQPD